MSKLALKSSFYTIIRASLSFVILPLILTLAAPSYAWAEFRVCNMTQSLVGVAIGYRDKEGWHSEGWWRIRPAHCETLLEEPLSSRYYYLHAEDARNEGRWHGPITMCVRDQQFLINGRDNCYLRGFQRAGFQEIDTQAQTRWTVQLTDNGLTGEGEN